jgi:hypothetical protein
MATKMDDKRAKRNAINVSLRDPSESPEDAVARILTFPEVQAGTLIQQLESDNHEANAVVRELAKQVAAVKAGDLSRPEAMLVCQAHALEELFCNLSRRATSNMTGGYLDAADRYFRLAFKAQAQCRTTLEALAEIKNPRPVAFVRQANIANGPQQVNNGVPITAQPSRAEKMESPQNELSEVGNELLSDARASQAESRVDTTVGTMGEIDGTEVGRR